MSGAGTALVAVPAAALAAALLVPGGRRPHPGRAPTARRSPVRPLPRHPPPLAAALAAGIVAALLAGPAAGLALAACTATVVLLRSRRARERAARLRLAAWVDALDALAARLRSGAPAGEALRAALAGAGPPDCPLSALADQLAAAGGIGAPVPPLLAAEPGPGRRLGVYWQLAAERGVPLAAAVERLRDATEAQLAHAGELEQALAGARASARILALLSPAGLLLGSVAGVHPLHVLLHTAVGGAALLLGTALDLAGLAVGEAVAQRAAHPEVW